MYGTMLLVTLLLAGCGGGSNPDAAPAASSASAANASSASAPAVAAPTRGSLLRNPPELMATVTAGDLLLQLSAAANQLLLGLSCSPACDIGDYHLEYNTVGGRGEATTASAALLVPFGIDARCRGARPIVLYAHGTTTNKAFNIADLKDAQNAEGLLLAALFASHGYIVVAPNYAGYDTSTLNYHAYLQAEQPAALSGPGQVAHAARARRGVRRCSIRRQSATSSSTPVIAYARVSMNTTLVVNAKGGVGKTTIATNLASYFAARGAATTIADFDPQGSSLNWIRQRPAYAARIAGADLAQRVGVGLPTGRRQIPLDTRQLIIDAPAGPSRLLLQDLLARAPHSILIPVAPSSIDIHATANFIRELLLVGHVRLRSTRVAVLANRVSGDRPVYEPLERFAAAMKISFIARVSDSRVYVDAAEAGLGVFDMPAERCGAEQREFLPIARWAQGVPVPEEHCPGKVVPFRSATV